MAYIPVNRRPIAYIDTETTGLNPAVHEVIDVAVVFDRDVAERLRLPHLTFPDGADYAFYASRIKPERLDVAEPIALQVNGYTAEAWADAPTAADVVKVLQVILKDVVCCGHNVSFDTEFIQAMICRTGSTFRMDYHKLDTVTLAYEHLVPSGLEKLSLDTIRDFLGWPKEGGHAALKDALDARRLAKLVTEDVRPISRDAWILAAT
jgi:DNA polymerase-3 subunit epsilon